MTKQEKDKCEKLMDEAVRNAENANEEFYKAGKCYDTTERHILETKAWSHRGYAEGIYQALAVIGYKSEKMEEIGKRI